MWPHVYLIMILTEAHEVMERDRRLTGTMRGQIANPEAPSGFELSNGWKVRAHIPAIGQNGVLRRLRLICAALDGKTNLLSRAPCEGKIKVGRNNVHIINTGQASQDWNSEGQNTKCWAHDLQVQSVRQDGQTVNILGSIPCVLKCVISIPLVCSCLGSPTTYRPDTFLGSTYIRI